MYYFFILLFKLIRDWVMMKWNRVVYLILEKTTKEYLYKIQYIWILNFLSLLLQILWVKIKRSGLYWMKMKLKILLYDLQGLESRMLKVF